MHWFLQMMGETVVNPVPVVNANDPANMFELFKTMGGFGMAAWLLIQQKSILGEIKNSLTTLTAIVAAQNGNDRRGGE